MSDTAQNRAIRNYRSRLAERGMARYEVIGRSADRNLIRSLARRLTQNDAEAQRLRTLVSRSVAGKPPRKGGILEALRRSPLVGADIIPPRPFMPGREIDL